MLNPSAVEVHQHFRGAKLPLKPMHIWGMRVRALLYVAIDSFAAATSSHSGRQMCWLALWCASEPWSFSRGPVDQFSSKSLTRRASRSPDGWSSEDQAQKTGCFRAEWIETATCPRGSTHDW